MLDTSNAGARQFCVRLPEELSDRLREAARAHYHSRGAELRQILDAHLAERPGARTDTEETTHA